MEILHEKNRVFINDESWQMLAELIYKKDDDGIHNISRTFVDPSLRGQGVAEKLMIAALDVIRKEGGKVRATCSYAVKWLEKHDEYLDLLTK